MKYRLNGNLKRKLFLGHYLSRQITNQIRVKSIQPQIALTSFINRIVPKLLNQRTCEISFQQIHRREICQMKENIKINSLRKCKVSKTQDIHMHMTHRMITTTVIQTRFLKGGIWKQKNIRQSERKRKEELDWKRQKEETRKWEEISQQIQMEEQTWMM